ncbi:MAG: hypothetical protein CL695_00460 [Chloroflexi bacterium]|nr:hypothetical protein [Chloroflexota bacterium]
MPQIESIKKIVKIARPNHRGAIIEFMANTGVRRGEAIALRWSDIGIVSKTAQINGSMQRIKHQGLKFVPTKSAAGRRAVALNSDALRVVNRRRIQQTEDRLKAGSEFTDNDLVFTTESGLPLDPDNLTHQFKRFAVKAGHPNLRLHDLRHFHAYALALSGAHPKVIQNQLGHASAAFTLQVYTHVDASLQAAAVQRTSGLLG